MGAPLEEQDQINEQISNHIAKRNNQQPQRRKFVQENYVNTHTFKALDSIGNCQRPVFSLGVSQRA